MAQAYADIPDFPEESQCSFPIPTIIMNDDPTDFPNSSRIRKDKGKKKNRRLEGRKRQGESSIDSINVSCELDFEENGRLDLSSAEAKSPIAMERADYSPYSSDAWEEDSDDDHTDSSDDDDPKSQVDRLIERGTLMYMDGENSGLSSEDESDCDSESDITDVSPIVSATASPLGLSPVLPRRNKPTSPLALHDNRSIYGAFDRDHGSPQTVDSTQMDLLLRAVLELENQQNETQRHSQTNQNVFKSHVPSPGLPIPRKDQSVFLHPIRDNPHHHHLRKNMSFTNEEVRKIDRENKILLKKIMAVHRRKPHDGSPVRGGPKAPSSSVNRRKNEERIRRDNLLLLRKIQESKPSKDLVSDATRAESEFASPHRGMRSPTRSCGASLRSIAKPPHVNLPTPRKETAL